MRRKFSWHSFHKICFCTCTLRKLTKNLFVLSSPKNSLLKFSSYIRLREFRQRRLCENSSTLLKYEKYIYVTIKISVNKIHKEKHSLWKGPTQKTSWDLTWEELDPHEGPWRGEVPRGASTAVPTNQRRERAHAVTNLANEIAKRLTFLFFENSKSPTCWIIEKSGELNWSSSICTVMNTNLNRSPF